MCTCAAGAPSFHMMSNSWALHGFSASNSVPFQRTPWQSVAQRGKDEEHATAENGQQASTMKPKLITVMVVRPLLVCKD